MLGTPHAGALLTDSWSRLLAERARTDAAWLILPHSPVDSDRAVRLSYADLHARATRMAHALRATGGEQGRTVVLPIDSGPEFALAYFGVVLAGMVPVPFPPPYAVPGRDAYRERFRGALRHCEAQFVLADAGTERAIAEAGQGTPVLVVERLLEDGAGVGSLPGVAPEAVGLVQYTSGTTAAPRAVELSHANVLHNVHAIAGGIGGIRARDVALCWLPMFHDMGLIGTLLFATYWGLPLVLLRPRSFILRPESWLWAISRFRATGSPAPNFAYGLCVSRIKPRRLEGLDLRSWRVAFNGAEPVQRSTVEAFIQRFGPLGFRSESMFPVYGMAENSLACCFPEPDRSPRFETLERRELHVSSRAMLAPSDSDSLSVASVGAPLRGQMVRIVRSDGREADAREIGEIQVKGPCVMRGYHADPAATQAVLDEDGWLRTGDRGYVADGALYVLGRTKDVIKRAGQRYDAAEIQTVTAEIAGIRGNTAVFGLTNEQTGTEDLIVVAETGAQDEDERARLRVELVQAIYKGVGVRPDRVELVAPKAIPRTTSGKISHQGCKALYVARTALAATPPADQIDP